MFTGLIEEVGKIGWIRATERSTQLLITAPKISQGLQQGDSVAVNGCCLTVTAIRDEDITFDLLEETVARTNFRELGAGSPVNLERALTATTRMGGHFVQGHIDCAARVLSFGAAGADYRLEVELPTNFARYVVEKGSIALDGISLTIAELRPASFVVWIIPHTHRETNLHRLQPGCLLNVEFDLLAKYVERLLQRPA
jgi:riboflavin synthase